MSNEKIFSLESTFKWSDELCVEHLTWAIKNKYYTLEALSLNIHDSEDFHIFCSCIDFFVHNEPVGQSYGTDGNAGIAFKVTTPDEKKYYLIGKLNRTTKEEEVHIFYNDGKFFDPLQCTYICGGSCDAKMYSELLKICGIDKNII
ncbi:MAG: hypothetical protein SO160_02260 [Lachnospiraceae bacterium]|nr:hypothetical protein [Lachnospiraceae bacterium]